ncbi:hypothetical protein ONS95_012819 [Cadophora gregata]|uniref:uncharacterized protein n=1 Tax=Cadophora gregata TaxID=51156 RepID=UPI0026DB9277|nr:uncharacterized protein ONS95_012819 [Cadophora gregata]KAK0115767.1 hypothetical protein ONS95_012819 [Cadophora gregata]
MHLFPLTITLLLSSLTLTSALPTTTTSKIHKIDTHYNSTRAIFPLPRYDTKTGKIESRNPFNPKSNACRISMYRDLYNQYHCDTECHNDYFLVEEVVVADNNSNERYATFPGLPANGQWRFQSLDGHRGFQVFLKYQSSQDWYGFREAYLHLEGHKSGDDRDMIHGGDCYYDGGSELWGQKGRAHCFLWCDQLNW